MTLSFKITYPSKLHVGVDSVVCWKTPLLDGIPNPLRCSNAWRKTSINGPAIFGQKICWSSRNICKRCQNFDGKIPGCWNVNMALPKLFYQSTCILASISSEERHTMLYKDIKLRISTHDYSKHNYSRLPKQSELGIWNGYHTKKAVVISRSQYLHLHLYAKDILSTQTMLRSVSFSSSSDQ